jgi:hypothetical protein
MHALCQAKIQLDTKDDKQPLTSIIWCKKISQ